MGDNIQISWLRFVQAVHYFSVEHALTCKTGGFSAVRYNEVRDITATLLTEVCHRVTTEPHRQPLTEESLSHCSAITEDGARLDVADSGGGGGGGKI